MSRFQRLLKEEDGLETVEYAIIAGLIVAAVVLLIVALGAWVKGQFTNMKTELSA